MTRPAIVVKDIHKEFVLPQTKNSSIKHAFVNIIKRNKKTVQKVLDGVSFTVNQGDFFGVVGRNGSGNNPQSGCEFFFVERELHRAVLSFIFIP